MLLLYPAACGRWWLVRVGVAVDGVWSLVDQHVLLLQSMACGR